MSALRRLLGVVLTAGALSAFASPAGAVVVTIAGGVVTSTYTFYTGGAGYTGPYSTPDTMLYDATKGYPTDCPTANPGCGADDIYAGTDPGTDPLVFSGLMVYGLPDSPSTRYVWDDLAPPYGGLGVGKGQDPDSETDQIAGYDVLELVFATPVTLTSVATLFASAHTGFGPGFPDESAVTAKYGFRPVQPFSGRRSLLGDRFPDRQHAQRAFADRNNVLLQAIIGLSAQSELLRVGHSGRVLRPDWAELRSASGGADPARASVVGRSHRGRCVLE